LPPYIRRSEHDPPEQRRSDCQDYQTVYASAPGAVAAPTAGMHFTSDLLHEIRHRVGSAIAELILHVGLGTFQPLEVDDLADHQMHREWYDLSVDTVATIQRAQAGGGRIIAVGTTSVRVLETCARSTTLRPQSGWTDLLIYPPYVFRATDALLTNFHLPGSTLLALVCAFAGRETVFEAYRCAIDQGYRFYSFGDAMLIL
jgi:S-adenosylmethionine:tRNA ribosyltransferase-isomerase